MAVKRKKEGTGTAYISYLEIVTLSDGTEIELPRLTNGRMAHISKSLSHLIDVVIEKAPEGTFNGWFGGQQKDGAASSDLGMQIVKLLPQMFPIVLDEIISLMALYLDEPREWIEELSPEDLTKIFSPFLKSVLVNMNQLLNMIGLSNIINTQSGTPEGTTLEVESTMIPEEVN